MNFWKLEHPQQQLAVIDAQTGQEWSYGQLREDVEQVASFAPRAKSLRILLAQNRYHCIVAYLAALNSGDALLLIDATLNRELLTSLIDVYRPHSIYAAPEELSFSGYRKRSIDKFGIYERERSGDDPQIHDSLALLLNTSGSTGSPKLVRLSFDNLEANASSIRSYLELSPKERPITSLPMAYSYGLSVINSHLQAGATIVLTDHGVVRREFWDSIDKYECTSFSGVPYTYQMLLQMGLLKKRGATLRTLTQAGGRLAEPYVEQMHALARERGFRFFVMYGQTEATARISYVPFGQLGSKIGSVGVAVPGGQITLDGETGELIYAGPNVMMGYAECREDLANGDELQGVLRTGDLARQDADGFFYITGRLKRFLKLFGKRFNLDEVEQIVQHRFQVPVACFGQDDLLIVAAEADSEKVTDMTAMLRETFGLPSNVVKVKTMETLPRTGNGKIDYMVLASECEQPITQVSRG